MKIQNGTPATSFRLAIRGRAHRYSECLWEPFVAGIPWISALSVTTTRTPPPSANTQLSTTKLNVHISTDAIIAIDVIHAALSRARANMGLPTHSVIAVKGLLIIIETSNPVGCTGLFRCIFWTISMKLSEITFGWPQGIDLFLVYFWMRTRTL